MENTPGYAILKLLHIFETEKLCECHVPNEDLCELIKDLRSTHTSESDVALTSLFDAPGPIGAKIVFAFTFAFAFT